MMLVRVVAIALLVSLAISGTSAAYAIGECVLKTIGNSTSTISGTIRFTQPISGEVTTVFGNLTGLTAGLTYYAKIHEYGDLYSAASLGGCSPNGEPAIEFTPLQPASTFITTTATNIELYPSPTSIIGRGVIISTSPCITDEIDETALVACVVGVADVTGNTAQAWPSSNPTSGYVKFTGTTGTYGDNRNLNGSMYFTMLSSGRMSGYFEVTGLLPYTVHGLHVHNYGDMSFSDATSAGEHFNPNLQYHAGPDIEARHEGDMGNVTANGEGTAFLLRTFDILSFTRYNYSILGHAVVLHTIRDDGNPLHLWTSTGSAGGRLAFGVVGYSARSSPFIASDSSSSTVSWKMVLAYVGIAVGIVLVVGTTLYCCCKRRPSADYHGI